MIDIKIWNELVKANNDTDIEAQKGDLVYLLDGIMFLVQTHNNCNNIVAQRVGDEADFINALRLLADCLLDEGIDCIQVRGRKGRYRFLEVMFRDIFPEEKYPNSGIVKDPTKTNEDFYYIKIK